MSQILMLDALFPPGPGQLIADLDSVGAVGVFVYVSRPGGVGNWTPIHVQVLRNAGKRVIPIIVPAPGGEDPHALLQQANNFGFISGPITLDLEPPNLPPAAWEEQFDAAARAAGFTDFDYGTPSNLGLYQPDDAEWKATWIRTGQLQPLPPLPGPPYKGWQFVNNIVINGSQYDASVIDDSIFGGTQPMPISQHLSFALAVSGKILTGAVWYNWGDALQGNLVPVGPAPVGQTAAYTEAVLIGNQWVDRILKDTGPGDWGLLDSELDTLDVSGCIDPPSCLAKQQPPPAPQPPPPAPQPPPGPDPRVDDLERRMGVVEGQIGALQTHRHPVTTSGTSGTLQ
jgi:hypothetical protein